MFTRQRPPEVRRVGIYSVGTVRVLLLQESEQAERFWPKVKTRLDPRPPTPVACSVGGLGYSVGGYIRSSPAAPVHGEACRSIL